MIYRFYYLLFLMESVLFYDTLQSKLQLTAISVLEISKIMSRLKLKHDNLLR